MAQNSKIEWTDDTNNIWWGCTKVHAGCDNCYAEHLSDVRYKNDLWGEGKSRRKIKRSFFELEKSQKLASSSSKQRKVFVGSMMDIFEKPKPVIDHKGESLFGTTTGDLRDILFANISDGRYDKLTFLFLTKRPSNINKYIPEEWKKTPPSNVFFGCSPVDQKTYENFYHHMKKVSGNTFYSIEPQLGNIKLIEDDSVNWIIQGGESGAKRRLFDLNWAYSMRNQCFNLGIPYFFKQIDKVLEIPEALMIRQFPNILL